MKENNKGITLIALVITIILLLILSAATINVIFSADGLFSKAVASKEEYKRSEVKDVISLAKVYVKEEDAMNQLDGLSQLQYLKSYLSTSGDNATGERKTLDKIGNVTIGDIKEDTDKENYFLLTVGKFVYKVTAEETKYIGTADQINDIEIKEV